MQRAQTGGRRALEQLYLIHLDRIYGYLLLSLGNRRDAEDVTNQTFIKMLESIDRFVWRQAAERGRCLPPGTSRRSSPIKA